VGVESQLPEEDTMCRHCPPGASPAGFCDDLIPEADLPSWLDDPRHDPEVLLMERADAGYYDEEEPQP
jgi:hypothetical protein